MTHRARVGRWLTGGLLLVGALGALLPFLWMVAFSFGRPQEFVQTPPPVIPSALRLDNYQAVFDRVPFLSFMWNSIWVTALVVAGQVLTCSLAAYAFARLRFPGKNVLFIILLASLMIPSQVTVVPLFLLMRPLGLVDNDLALVLPGLVSAFGVFLLRQYFQRIPAEIEDAARLDGASHLQIYLRIMLPLAAPALAALAILAFNATWNSYLWPLIAVNSPQNMTIPVGITFLSGQFGTVSSGVITAAVTMSVIPPIIMFVIFQRRLVEGISLSGGR
jgi:multiple sugar transport system permease protein